MERSTEPQGNVPARASLSVVESATSVRESVGITGRKRTTPERLFGDDLAMTGADGCELLEKTERRFVVHLSWPERYIIRRILRSGTPAVSLLLVSHLFAQSVPQPADGPPHRFDYAAEHFSIELPAPWHEVDQSTVRLMGSVTQQLLPNFGSAMKVSHAYTPSDLMTQSVIIALTGIHYTDAYFKKLSGADQSADSVSKYLPADSPFRNVQTEAAHYDTDRHLFWSTGKLDSVLTGELRMMTGLYITKAGTVMVTCASKAAEFAKLEAECRQIIGSVQIDPKVAMTPPAPIEELLKRTTEQANSTYRQLVDRVKAGDFSVDFRELRMACARSNVCEKRAAPAELADLYRAQSEKRYTDAIDLAQKQIDHGFINIEAHLVASQAYTALNQPEKTKFHMDVMMALLQSVITSDDGGTEATAYEVISFREMYCVMASRNLPYGGDDVVSTRSYTAGGHQIYRYEVRDPKTQQNIVIFFNTDAMPQIVTLPRQ